MVGWLRKEGSELGLIRRAAAWLTKVLDHLASFEDRRKAFVSTASSSFSIPTELQMYTYGASRSPVSLPISPGDRYAAKDIRGIVAGEAGGKLGDKVEAHQEGEAARRNKGKDAGRPKQK